MFTLFYPLNKSHDLEKNRANTFIVQLSTKIHFKMDDKFHYWPPNKTSKIFIRYIK